MELTTGFLQGVSSAGGYFYTRAVGTGDNGLFLMDVRTGQVSILHTNNIFHSISYAGNGTFRGWATNTESEVSYVYEFSTLTGTLSVLGNVENASDINYAQGVYSFDPSENALYMKGFRYVDLDSGTMEWGIFKFDLSSGQITFEENESAGEWNYFEVLDGIPVYFIAGSAYSIPQGVMTYDEVNNLYYTTSWIFDDNSGAITGQQILQLGKNGNVLEVLKSFEIKHDEFVYDIVYDSENEMFFALVADGDTNIVVAVDFSGNLFNVGSKNNDSHVGTMSDDNYLGLGGADNLVGNGGDDILIGGVGADTVSGGADNDILIGGSGDDNVDAGSGDDLIIGGDGAGNDRYIGGTGTDTVKYTSALSGITVNLSASSNHAKSTLSGDRAGIGIDQLSGIENIIAGSYNDILTGNASSNRIDAGKGNDKLYGGIGNDTLRGDSGNDSLQGDAGKDSLTGGSGADSFIFRAVSESATGATTADVITDFVRGTDKIDLSAIDASTILGGNNAFSFNGTTKFGTSTQGEIYYKKFSDHTMVYIDNDGDNGVEMAIRLTGLHNLTASDFVL